MASKASTPCELAAADGSALDFHTAPYEALCGCVAVEVPRHCNYAYQTPYGVERVNHDMTRQLIENGKGCRNVMANCPKCHGTGLVPNAGGEGQTPPKDK